MGNKQTIFTDEQLDAYQVRLASSLLCRARRVRGEVVKGGLADSLRK